MDRISEVGITGLAGVKVEVELITREIESSIAVKHLVLEDMALVSRISTLVEQCIESLSNGGKIIFCGNGGSFADAQHLSAEFTSRFMFDRPSLASLALGTNSSTLSALGNDYGYENVFAREMESIGQVGDVFIAISTSGNSANVIKAVDVAKRKGITTIVLTGKSGGKIGAIAECICIPSENTARIQECHIMLGHILCALVEDGMFGSRAE